MELILSLLLALTVFTCLLGVAYSKIIAPTIQRRLQFRIFQIRDNGRIALIENRITNDEFAFIEDRCNFAISLIEIIDPALMLKIDSIIRGLSAEQRSQLDSKLERFKDSAFVLDSMSRIALAIRKAVVANSGFWGVLFWSVLFLSKWVHSIKRSRLVQSTISSTKEIASAFPSSALEQLRRYPMRPVRIPG
jgi:hypothetical protein